MVSSLMSQQLAETLRCEFAAGRFRELCFASFKELADFESKLGCCHDNAKRWVEKHPDYRVVEGWITYNRIFSHFVKHSVVEKAPGGLLCVTPHGLVKPEPIFVEHKSSWAEGPFDKLDPTAVVCPGIDRDEWLTSGGGAVEEEDPTEPGG